MEKLSPKESVEGADTVLRGSVRATEGFSEGKPEAAKPRGRSPQGFAAEDLRRYWTKCLPSDKLDFENTAKCVKILTI